MDGLTTVVEPVKALLQVYVIAPEAVSVDAPFVHTTEGLDVIPIVGVGFTVT